MTKVLRVGRETFDFGPPIIFEGLLSTITYRLEPNGRGTRFPKVKRLFDGRLHSAEIREAAQELEEIEAWLTRLPPDRAVWSLSDLRRRDDRALPVNRSASSIRDYFVANDGRPLVTALREAVRLGLERNAPVRLANAKRRKSVIVGWVYMFGGLIWTLVGYGFFQNIILTSGDEAARTMGGPLIWPFGIFMTTSGVLRLLFLRYPALQDWFEDRVWLSVSLIVAALGLYLAVAWRH